MDQHLGVEIGLFLSLYLWWLKLLRRLSRRREAILLITYGNKPSHQADRDDAALRKWLLTRLAEQSCELSIEDPRDDFRLITITLASSEDKNTPPRVFLEYVL